MHDDVTRPKATMAVVVMLKSKMAVGSTISGEILKVLRRHIESCMRDYNFHNARSSCNSIVLRHYA